MNTQRQIRLLRLSLLDMAKLSQRAVDYAVKGYKLGSPEFCRFVHRGEHQIRELRRKINDHCRRLFIETNSLRLESLHEDPYAETNHRFVLSTLRISTALQAASTAAAEIAHHTLLSLDNVRFPGSPTLDKFCRLVNRLMSLCIVALFKQEVSHAEAVLQNRELACIFENPSVRHRRDELPISSNLKQIAAQVNEIAAAIVYWLEGTECLFESRTSAV
jgi:phosphate uptake regulator